LERGKRDKMRNILLINRLGIGDVVLTTPLAGLVKEYFDSRVGMVVSRKALDLLNNHPWIDDCFAYEKHSQKELICQISQRHYGEAIIVDGRFSSTQLAVKAGCRLKNVGFEISIGSLRPFPRKQRALRAVVDYSDYIRCLDPLVKTKALAPKVGDIDQNSYQKITVWLNKHEYNRRPLVLIVPRGISPNKNWPVENHNGLNLLLNQQGIIPVYLGSMHDHDYIASFQGKIVNAAGEFSLREVAVLAQSASVTVTPCTGTMHVIATSGTPIVALYGPTDPRRWAPSHAEVLQAKLACVPCQKLTCSRSRDECHQCMKDISPETVFKAIEPFLCKSHDKISR
jgi:ADP-heptose:LPS heptosyltransferase